MSDPLTVEDLHNRFTYHAPSPGQPEKYDRLRAEARRLALTIRELCPHSRERSLALTELQSAIMWANASIACNERDSSETVIKSIIGNGGAA